MKCPACGHANPAGQKFCGECGQPLVARCAACGTVSPPGQKFCGQCGRPLTTATAPPAAARFDAPTSYTPEHLAARILMSKAALEGERKQVTVLFADMKGSMELLADRDPEEARAILDPVLQRLMDAVHRYEGTVNQVMGDGIMALFGAPLAHEDHAVRACYAALRMHESIRRYTEDVRRAFGIEIQIRVGINSGDVVVRSIGSDLRMDYTAVGQTTHLAARMEQLAPAGAVRLTADTVRLAEAFVQVRPLGPIPVKGVAEPVEAFELTGTSAIRTRLQAARARGLTRFVGRDAEIHQMRQAAEQARRGRGQLVAVVGEPGVGKSRLVHEFLQSHHAHGWLVLEASSVSYGKATPFLTLAELLRSYLRIDDRDDTRGVRAKVAGSLMTLDRTLEDAVPAVLWLLDALPADDAFLAVDPAVRRQRAVDAAKRLLLRESQVQPLLLVFEDLHWVDAETQHVLDSLVDGLPTASVLLAVNYRPEYRHRWGGKTYYRQLRIDPLAPESADELLQALIGDDVSLAPLKRLLVERTEGNPLFLEESVRTLLETRGLVGEPGAYRLARRLDAMQMPATVQAILAARIDRLSPELKRLLQAAAVVGKDVAVSVLEPIADLEGEALRRGLAELQTAEFLYETRLYPDLEYTFKHALTHETAYASVLQDRRRALHAAIVEAIERRYADRLGEHVELLAHHAVRGELPAKAVRYLREAGEKSQGRSATVEAVGFFQSALEQLARLPETRDTLSDELDIRIVLGPALIALRGAADPAVHELYERANELADQLGDGSRRFPARWGVWFITYTLGRYAAARDVAAGLLEDALAGDDSGRLVEAHHAMWPTLLAMGEAAAAVPYMERGIALYDKDHHASQGFLYAGHDLGVCCRYQLSLARWLLGWPDGAVAVLRDAERLADELRHAHTRAITLWFAVVVLFFRGERDAAAMNAERLIAIADEYGYAPWKDVAIVAGPATRTRLDTPALADLHRRLMGIKSAAWRRAVCLCILTELSLEAGRADEGRRALASLRDDDRSALLAPEILRLGGELELMQSGTAEAERSFERAIEIARRRGEKSLELRASTSLARLLAARGASAEARRVLADVYGWFTEGLETRDLREARTVLAALG